MTAFIMHPRLPTGSFQRPSARVDPSNEAHRSHSGNANAPVSSSPPLPFFLQRPSIARELASRLIPVDVDLHTKKNTEAHSTNHYDIPGLVLRRGQAFSYTVTFNRDYDPEQFQLFVRLAIGSRSMISKRTQIRMLVDGPTNGTGWSARRLPLEGEKDDEMSKKRIALQIDSPSDAIIGKYTLLLEVRPVKKDDPVPIGTQDLNLFLFEVDIYFLFNPWQRDDACSLPSPEQINEYVMNEHGQIYLGSSDKPHAVPWYFGQFERASLLTALALLDRAQLPSQNRADPSVILRILSSKVCSNPGTNTGIFPSAFDSPAASSHTSSSAVLKQYLLSNGRSVQGGSGSNWQHAAILCTLTRALGMPCRIVTIYNAACRTDGTENNDIHWDTKQRPLKQLNNDWICSSHVWNECWMRRQDFHHAGHDWQVVDSTPVRMCDGIRRTGPCAVSALKKGELGSRWDSPFLHAAINGRKSHWKVYPDGNMDLLDVEENTVGTKILTRSVTNEFEPEDITEHYKGKRQSGDDLATRMKHDVDIQLKKVEDIQLGDEIVLELTATNKSKQTRTLTTTLTVCLTDRTGQRFISCHNQPVQIVSLAFDRDHDIQFKVDPKHYAFRGQEDSIAVKCYLQAFIKETHQTFTRESNIVFSKPDLIKLSLDEDVIEIGKSVLLGIELTNTLSRPLHNGRIHIDGLGVSQLVHINRSLAPKESTTIRSKVFPTRLGVSRLYATYLSDDICSLAQTIPLEILGEPLPAPSTEKVETADKEKTSVASHKPVTTEKVDEVKSIPAIPTVSITEDKSAEKPLAAVPAAKSDATPAADEEDEVEELFLKKNPTGLQANPTANVTLAHGSTLSLDKDKMSVDSLDISNERRNAASNSSSSSHPQ